ncbi:hypothetical protein jhhlp_003897 [Lomentospora prolificans]|uniref:CCHC-type domain-containing protein n=1 Tax=Lomentospora prolificans TaxID=41688 RepID=A0A2N3NA17_9PEZI|nr:hypothetical protein jhhlp_003897 [Lomentospora prolificans]
MSSGNPSKQPSCKNCGADGHWMIDCYEPTRKVPAGLRKRKPEDASRSGEKNSFKKHKGAIINKYGPPPGVPYGGHASSYGGPPTSQHPYGASHPSTPGAHYPAYGGPQSPGPQSPHGHYAPHSSHGPVPPPGVVAVGPPYSAPAHSHPYGIPEPYGGHHPPSGSTPLGTPSYPPQIGSYFPPQPPYPNASHHGHRYPPRHQPYPPPQHYPPPQSRPLPPHPSLPTPPPHVGTPDPGHYYPRSNPPPHPYPHHPHGSPGPVGESYAPPFSGPPGSQGPPYHPQPPQPTPHGFSAPPPFSNFEGPGSSHPFGPGSGIRVLPPKPTVEVMSNHSHGPRKERNRNWKNRKGTKDDTAKPGRPGLKGERANRSKDPLKGKDSKGEVGKPPSAKPGKKGKRKPDAPGPKPQLPKDSSKSEGDTASVMTNSSEEGEVLDEDSQFKWDEKMIFKDKKEMHPADAVAGPLPCEYTDTILLPPAWNAEYIVSQFVNPDNRDQFTRPARETQLWGKYKDVAPFRSPKQTSDEVVDSSALQRLLATRRSSINPGPRREPSKGNESYQEGQDSSNAGTQNLTARESGQSSGESISAEVRLQQAQKERRPIIDSYRPNYGSTAGSNADRRRHGSSKSPTTRLDSADEQVQNFKKALEERDREGVREGSVESDLNSLENELLGLPPKSSGDEEKEKKDESNKKKGEGNKRSSDDRLPRMKRRGIKMDSAFSRRW